MHKLLLFSLCIVAITAASHHHHHHGHSKSKRSNPLTTTTTTTEASPVCSATSKTVLEKAIREVDRAMLYIPPDQLLECLEFVFEKHHNTGKKLAEENFVADVDNTNKEDSASDEE